MNKNAWITVVVVALVVGGGGFYAGEKYQAGQAPAATTGAGTFAGRGAGGFAGRTGGAGGGATFGTIVAMDASSITVQLPTSTSTAATTGSKVVLYDSSTQVQELQSVSPSSLSVGQSVTVAGTTNSDGSVTAQSIQIRPANGRGQ